MNLSTLIFAAVTTILIIVLIVIIYRLYKKGKKEYEEAFNKSNGGWDRAARTALEMLNEIPEENRQADENFAIAAGLQNNYFEGNIDQIRNQPEIGNVIVNRYNMALGNIRRGELGNIAANFIIRNAENFARAIIIPRIMDDIRNFDLDNLDQNNDVGEMIFAFGPAPEFEFIDLLNNANITRRQNMTERKEEAKKESGGVPAAAAEIYLKKSKTHTSDTQNVHDSAVSKAMKDTYNKISVYAARNTPNNIRNEILDFIDNKVDNNLLIHNKAKRCLEKIYNNPSFNSTIGATDMQVLSAVWERSKDKENIDNKNNIQEAIIHALGDMNPGGSDNINDIDSMVCVTGRTSRLLESLTLLDADKTMSAAATVEMYRNEIFDNAKKIIDDRINNEKGEIGDYYRGKITEEPIGSAEFKAAIIRDLNSMIDTYIDRVPAADLAKLKDECAAAI